MSDELIDGIQYLECISFSLAFTCKTDKPNNGRRI